MLKCTLGDKVYSIPYVNGRALREMDAANAAYDKIITLTRQMENEEELTEEDQKMTVSKLIEPIVDWFCDVLFRGQFSTDEFYDNYPVDCMISDLVATMQAVQGSVTDKLKDFPTIPTGTTEKKSDRH